MKDNDQQKISKAYRQINEGAFGGPGGNPDKEGWGEETSDDYTDEDIDGRLREVSSQVNTLVKWIDEGHRPEGDDIEDSFNDLDQLGQAINGFIMKHNVDYTVHGDPQDWRNRYDMSDDEIHDDPPRRETDQEKYGYPGDR